MFDKLFTSRLQLVVFVVYIAIWVLHGQLITWSKGPNRAPYSAPLTVLFAELGKCIVCLAVYRRSGNTFAELAELVKRERKLWVLYLIPSSLYAAYNICSFYSLERTDPPTYFIFLQLRSLVSGVVYQILFKQRLSSTQWASMAMLTVGAIIKELTFERGLHFNVSSALPFIITQIIASCIASVYNEYLIKSKDVDFWVQNLFFYSNSIIINFMVFISIDDTASNNLEPLFQVPVILVIVNMVAIGITTSMFLKHLNAILKNFASALELLITTVASFVIFGIPINAQTVISIIIIWLSMYMYAMNPIQTKPHHPAAADKKPLLKEEEV